jgi:hypothetical protein
VKIRNAGLPVILMDRQDAYPTKTARNDIRWPPVSEGLLCAHVHP